MIDKVSEFHFLRPYWLLAAPLLLWLAWRASGVIAGSGGNWRHLVDAALQPYVLRSPEVKPSRIAHAMVMLAALLATLALAGPAWERLPQPVLSRADARVIVVALTSSMLAGDVAPSRIERVRYKLRDFLGREAGRPHALIVYAGDAHVVAPLTNDVATIDLLLTALAPNIMPVPGNDPLAAINLAVGALRHGTGGRGEILLVTDNLGDATPAQLGATLPAGISLSVLGVGTDAGAPVPDANGEFMRTESGELLLAKMDRAGLSKLAADGHGKFTLMSADDSDLDALVSTTIGHWQQQDDGARFDQWADRGQWLVWALLPLVLAGFRRGWLAVICVALLLPMAPAQVQAGTLADVFRNDDQRGVVLLESGDAVQAAKTFIDPAWRARALYRAGQYDEAAKAWQALPGADAAYNRGNALAFMRDFDNALAAYDAALKIAPNHTDAKFNRALVEKLRSEQKQEQQKKQQDKQDKNQDGKQQKDTPGQNTQQEKPQQQNGQAPGAQKNTENQQAGEQQKNSQTKGAQQKDTEQKDTQQKNPQEKFAQNLSGDKKDGPASAGQQQSDKSEQLARDAWLEQIPDDPGEWLRRKFWLQSHPQQGGSP